MFGFLRAVRVICGLLFALQIVGLLPVFSWTNQPDAITAGMWAIVFIKVVLMAIFGGLFFGLRTLINHLHSKKHGAPHPALVKVWAL
jgi:hypothetical protein